MNNDYVNIDNYHDVLVVVRRQPKDHRTAVYRLSEIEDLRWSNRSGGVRSSFMIESIYGYVSCEGAVSGEVSHTGIHGRCPHSIKVCALKADNEKKVYEILLNIVGPQPISNRSKPSTGNMCKVDIVDILKKNGAMKSSDLIEELTKIGHSESNSKMVLKKLVKQEILICEKYVQDKRYNSFRMKA